jgi:hypothetical protein
MVELRVPPQLNTIGRSVADGLAYTEQSTNVYNSIDSSAFAYYEPVATTALQKVSLKVNPYWFYSYSGCATVFTVFTEFWIDFGQPTGTEGYTQAEVMIKLGSYAANGASPAPTYEHTLNTENHWYFLSETINPQIQTDTWSVENDLNVTDLLQDLTYWWGVDLSLGKIGAINFGTEGVSEGGGIAAAWDYYNYQVWDANTVTVTPESSTPHGTTNLGYGACITTGNAHLKAYADTNYEFAGWEIISGDGIPNDDEFEATEDGTEVVPHFTAIIEPPPENEATLIVQAFEYPDTPVSVNVQVDSTLENQTECIYYLSADYHDIEVPTYDDNMWSIWYTNYDGDFLCNGQPGTIYLDSGSHTITFYYITGR